MLALNIAAGRRPRLASLHRTDKLEDFGAALQIIQFARAQAAKQARPAAPFRRPSRLGALQQDANDVVRDFYGHLVAAPCDCWGGDLCWGPAAGDFLGYLVGCCQHKLRLQCCSPARHRSSAATVSPATATWL